jgi:membrane-associated phospholipid phosphatase
MFFSGHTALAVLGAIEVCHLAPGWLAALAVLLALGEALIVLVLRAHYTLDVVAGAFAAWFAADMAALLAPMVDAWLG